MIKNFSLESSGYRSCFVGSDLVWHKGMDTGVLIYGLGTLYDIKETETLFSDREGLVPAILPNGEVRRVNNLNYSGNDLVLSEGQTAPRLSGYHLSSVKGYKFDITSIPLSERPSNSFGIAKFSSASGVPSPNSFVIAEVFEGSVIIPPRTSIEMLELHYD